MKQGLVLIVIALTCAFSQIHASHLNITYAGDPLTEKERAQIERMMNYEMEFYGLFGLPDSLNVRLTVFEKRSDGLVYLDSLGVSQQYPLSTVDGIYIENRKEAVILGMEKGRKKVISLIYHELSHFLTRRVVGTRPASWLMEGLSEYFEHCEVSKKGIKHEMDAYEKGRLRTMYMLGEVDLLHFVDADKAFFMKKQRTDEQYAYILAHALVTFLLEKTPRSVLQELVSLLQNKTDLSLVSEKLGRAYPGGFDKFTDDVAQYYR